MTNKSITYTRYVVCKFVHLIRFCKLDQSDSHSNTICIGGMGRYLFCFRILGGGTWTAYSLYSTKYILLGPILKKAMT